ncbi:MAG: sortase [Anaerolineales bacterium]
MFHTRPLPALSIFIRVLVILILFMAAALPPITGRAASPAATGLGAIQTAVLNAIDPLAYSEFGWAVDMSTTAALVGARNADGGGPDDPIANSGAAYIYQYSGGWWYEESKLTSKDPEIADAFGVSVTIDGSLAVVGATGKDIQTIENAGAAYAFEYRSGAWQQRARLTASDAMEDDAFGTSVALDGRTLVVGADAKTFGPLPYAGAAYVFTTSGGEWTQRAKLMPLDPSPGLNFGASAAIDGDRIVIGATESNPGGIRGTGSAYVFKKVNNLWVQEAKLVPDEARAGDFFGQSVAIYGNTIVVGAQFTDPESDDGRITNAGAAYVFVLRDNQWEEDAQLVADDAAVFAQFGESVSVYGDRVVVGASGSTAWGLSNAGSAYLYIKKGREWVQQFKMIPDAPQENGYFGEAVSISGGGIMVGGTGYSPPTISRAGQAFAYRLGTVQLPETGYTQRVAASLAAAPETVVQAQASEMQLEIPALGVKTGIVGAAKNASGWETAFLDNQVGYLEGTAFPTWKGNTAIAGHVNLPNGLAGPFARLGELRFGDQVLIRAWGAVYVYEVRSNQVVYPDDTSVLKHEDYDWLTLITCGDYDAELDQFLTRQVIRAVLVEVRD